MIPKLLHQIWFQGEDQIPDKYQKYYSTCNKINPDYLRKVWDKESIEELLEQYPEYRKTYYNFPLMIQKIDFAKYLILYHYGGLYVDMDMYCLKPVDKLIEEFQDNTFICNKSFLTKTEKYLVHLGCYLLPNRRKRDNYEILNNGIIITVPKQPLLKYLLDQIKEMKVSKLPSDELLVFTTTGPLAYTEIIYDYIMKNNDNSVKIIDCEFVEPRIKPTSKSYFFHDCQATWQNNINKKFSQTIMSNDIDYDKILIISLIILIVVIALIAYLVNKRKV